MDSKVIGLWSNVKDHFNALILTVLTLFSTTGLVEDSSHLRVFVRVAAICVKGKVQYKETFELTFFTL